VRIATHPDRVFELGLPAVARGRDARGKEFEEQTQISALSAATASFSLDTRILIGGKVWLTASVPQTPFLRVPLRLSLVGSVIRVEIQKGRPKRQTVSLRLEKYFRLGRTTS
jgi:hypothetical protein